jgi:single-strand DNA-binding protein
MSQRFESTGTIKRIGETEVKSEKFQKRELTLEIEDGKYMQTCSFQVTGDRCSSLDEFSQGDTVKVAWNLRGREWSGGSGGPRVFNSLDIWRIERVGAAKTASSSSSSSSPSPGDAPQDDIPF